LNFTLTQKKENVPHVLELRKRNYGCRILTWTDGFYNGEVKTRKIANSAELTADQLIMQRSEQLRELYEALGSGKCDRRARAVRPVASLSPEDLSDTEWYYVTSMTYAFRPGQGYLYYVVKINEIIITA
jgi:hypothetical protein